MQLQENSLQAAIYICIVILQTLLSKATYN